MTKKTLTENDKYWLDNGVDIIKRRVQINDDIENYSIGITMRGIEKMLDNSTTLPIDIEILTYGGDVYMGLALYDLIERCPVLVRTYATGPVMSMGVIIYLAGHERYASKRVRFMAHSVSLDFMEGKVADLKVSTNETQCLQNDLELILRDRTKRSKNWWADKIETKDYYLNYKEAKKLGLITHEEE